MFDFSNYSAKSKYYDDSNKLVVGKMKNEIVDVAVKEFVGLKLKMYSFLVDVCMMWIKMLLQQFLIAEDSKNV